MNFNSIIIVTYGRSGSTLLQGILNSIDGCVIRGENNKLCVGLFEAFKSMVETMVYKVNGPDPTHPRFGAHKLNPDGFLKDCELMMRKQLLADQYSDPSVLTYGFKEIRYPDDPEIFPRFLAFLRLIFPNCAFVFNTRDHNQVKKSLWWANMEEQKVFQLLQKREMNYRSYWANNKDHSFMIRYEDVVSRNYRLKSLFEFLGAEFDLNKIEDILNTEHSVCNNSFYEKQLE